MKKNAKSTTHQLDWKQERVISLKKKLPFSETIKFDEESLNPEHELIPVSFTWLNRQYSIDHSWNVKRWSSRFSQYARSADTILMETILLGKTRAGIVLGSIPIDTKL